MYVPIFQITVFVSLNHCSQFSTVIVLKYKNSRKKKLWSISRLPRNTAEGRNIFYTSKTGFFLKTPALFPGNSTLPTFHIFLHTSDLRIPALTFASLSLLWLTAETSTLVCSIPLYSSSKSGAVLHLAKRRLVSSCHACKTLASKDKMLLCLIHCSREVFSVNRQNQILCILQLLLTVYISFYHIFGVS